MGAKTAAAAMMAHDADLANAVRNLPDDTNAVGPAAAQLVRDTAGTWTLALAAASAGVSERQVLVALVQKHIHPSTAPAAAGFVDAALTNRI